MSIWYDVYKYVIYWGRSIYLHTHTHTHCCIYIYIEPNSSVILKIKQKMCKYLVFDVYSVYDV